MERINFKYNFSLQSFRKLKNILTEYKQEFLIEIDETGIYYLAYPPKTENEQPELFAALEGRGSNIYLYMPALKTYARFDGLVPPSLERYLDTSHYYLCFPDDIADYEDALHSLLTTVRQMRETAGPVSAG